MATLRYRNSWKGVNDWNGQSEMLWLWHLLCFLLLRRTNQTWVHFTRHEFIPPNMSQFHPTTDSDLDIWSSWDPHCWVQQKGVIKKRPNTEQCEGKVGSCCNVPLFWILEGGSKGIATKKSVLYLALERLHSHKNIKIAHKSR